MGGDGQGSLARSLSIPSPPALLECFMEYYISVSKWGMFPAPAPKHEPETIAAKKRIERLLFPVMERVVDIKI
jgi:hypothetical protein